MKEEETWRNYMKKCLVLAKSPRTEICKVFTRCWKWSTIPRSLIAVLDNEDKERQHASSKHLSIRHSSWRIISEDWNLFIRLLRMLTQIWKLYKNCTGAFSEEKPHERRLIVKPRKAWLQEESEVFFAKSRHVKKTCRERMTRRIISGLWPQNMSEHSYRYCQPNLEIRCKISNIHTYRTG